MLLTGNVGELAATQRGSRPGGAIRIAHYDVIDDDITWKL